MSRGLFGLAAAYTAFAALATAANIGAQMLTIAWYRGPWPIPLSIGLGTGVGLALKYVLDKRYIFAYETRNLAHDGRLFMLYTAMGIVTTLVFWGVEYSFHVVFHSAAMRYLGGVIGLAIGYTAKYALDRRFVFSNKATPA